ncbi:hypothetical protein SAMN05216207_10521 [Pseudonocardia ammonioxydans]|uniref:Uncharacterized protein n=1 Tax=Pseudonocardia ammonioxydans TaxID=260086 RepID=A0A1I5GWI0_PSUAM|nr:hypothetical protein [Pseudonocardia ammonioxydans]SFO40253.1 hypothetical protein SAMN05216207_10521 [Pseudonocardia ammonioxydans]
MTEESIPPQTGTDEAAGAETGGEPPSATVGAPTAVLSAAAPAGRGVELEECQFPGGCPNAIAYAGTGRRPKYCYQVVGGVMHDRGNAKRVLDGGAPARRRGEPDDPAPRPVTRAQQTVQAQVTGLVSRLEEASGELRDALGNLADPDAVAAEIAAARRAARAEIDQAQAGTDEAQARARTAEADAAAARRSAAASDEDAETAGQARQLAEDAQARAETERDDLAGQLSAVRAELETTQHALDEVRTERARLQRDLDTTQTELASAAQARDAAGAERDRLHGELTELTRTLEQVQADRDTALSGGERLRIERDTARAETAAARRDTERLRAERDQALTDRDTRAGERDTAREQAADARTQLAVAEATVTALRDQLDRDLDRERAYGQQRLDDADTRHHAREQELRDELAQLRAQLSGSGTSQDTSEGESPEPAGDAGPARGGRDRRRATNAPRPARRRRGADSAPGDAQTADPEGKPP